MPWRVSPWSERRQVLQMYTGASSLLESELANRAFSHDVTAAMLVFQNKGMAAMMVYQTNPPGIELYFYVNNFFCFSNPIWLLVM